MENTNRCTAKCAMCYLSAGENGKGDKLDMNVAKKCIREAAKQDCIAKRFHLAGGESFIYKDDCCELFACARKAGFKVISCTTNAFWSKKLDNARRVCEEIRKSGLTHMEISWDYWHYQFVSPETINNCLQACYENEIATNLRLLTTRSHQMKEVMDLLDPDAVKLAGKISCGQVAAVGRATKFLNEDDLYSVTAEKLTLKEGVKTIKENAFRDCTSLKDIYFSGTAREWEAVTKEGDWNNNVPADLEVHCSQEPEPEPEPGPGPEPEPDPDPDLHPGIRFFRMPELPGTGFSAKHPQILDDFPKDLRYEPSGLTLQIPSLDMAEGIVTVPFRNGEYPVEWLGKNIGLPEEFALPGSGRSILLGHDHLNTAEAGPFALLGMLTENARVIISDENDHIMTYSVFANEKIAADDMAEAERLSASCENSLILITCEDERPEGGYASRRIVAAKPVLPGE